MKDSKKYFLILPKTFNELKTSYSNSKGLHILLTLKVTSMELLSNYAKYVEYTKKILSEHDTEVVGETFYVFENNSFTSALCLKESHICIHTWPEFQQLTLDVLLCNYIHDNTHKVEKIARQLVEYFEGEIIQEDKIYR